MCGFFFKTMTENQLELEAVLLLQYSYFDVYFSQPQLQLSQVLTYCCCCCCCCRSFYSCLFDAVNIYVCIKTDICIKSIKQTEPAYLVHEHNIRNRALFSLIFIQRCNDYQKQLEALVIRLQELNSQTVLRLTLAKAFRKIEVRRRSNTALVLDFGTKCLNFFLANFLRSFFQVTSSQRISEILGY